MPKIKYGLHNEFEDDVNEEDLEAAAELYDKTINTEENNECDTSNQVR